MTPPNKRTTAEVWRALEKIADEVASGEKADAIALEKVAALDDEALDRALREAGIDPAAAANVGLEALRTAPAGDVTEPPSPVGAKEPPSPADAKEPPARAGAKRARSARPLLWLAAAALFSLLVVFVWVQGQPEHVSRPPPPSREEAADLRDEAFGLCAQGRWAECEARLDDARDLDPAGEADPRVRAARQSVGPPSPVDGGHRNDRPPSP